MPVYEYSCQCGESEDLVVSIHADLPQHLRCPCGGMMRRRFSAPAFHRFSEHFNHSLGKPVSSKKDFKTSLYEAQEQMTERLGWQQSFVEAEPQVGRTEDGMQATHDTRKALGMST
jgi:putative FmdB family regulatory protein